MGRSESQEDAKAGVARVSWIARLAGSPWFWVAAALAMIVIPMKRALFTRLPPILPVVGTVPEFTLIDQSGRRFGSDDLRGRVWLGVAFSPSGPDGRAIGEKVKRIQHRAHQLGKAFHIACITSNPEGDAPLDLDAFVRGEHGSPRMWTFLTGDAADVDRLIAGATDGPTGRGLPGEPAWLVDGTMHVRARYDLREADIVETVLRDVGNLVNRG